MITVKQFLDAGFKLMVGDVLVAQHITSPLNSADMEAIDFGVTEYIDYKIKSLDWRKNEGKQPVKGGLPLTVEFIDGVNCSDPSDYFYWTIEGLVGDIIRWKPNLAALEQQMNDKQDMMTQAESDEIEHLEKSALEMSERDVPSFDEPIIANPFDACASNEDGDDAVEWHLDDDGIPPIGVDVMVSYTVDGDPDGWCDAHGPSQLVAFEFGMVWIAHHGVHHRLHKAEDVEFTKYVKPESPEEKAAREREEAIKSMPSDLDYEQLFWNIDSIYNRRNMTDSVRMDIKNELALIINEHNSSLYDAGYHKG